MNKDEALKTALAALEEIAFAGMSGSGQESEDAMTEWHARQAWKFISIAARSLETIKQALEQPDLELQRHNDYMAGFNEGYERAEKQAAKANTAPAQPEPTKDEHQAFIDSLSADHDDKMFMQIDHWARESYRRHKSSVRGQIITAADNSDSHLIWAALRWAKENTPPEPFKPITADDVTDEMLEAVANAADSINNQLDGNETKGAKLALAVCVNAWGANK